MSHEKTNLYDLSSPLAICIPPQAHIVQLIIIRLNLMDCLRAALKIKQTTAYLSFSASSIFVRSKDIFAQISIIFSTIYSTYIGMVSISLADCPACNKDWTD